jgi:di/tricarboxylate transporter
MAIVITLAIVAIALILFVGEWIPADITALLVAATLMGLRPILVGLDIVQPDQWITPDEGVAGFGEGATITVLAMFILSAGVTKTGVIQLVSEFLQRWGGNRPSRQILVLGSIVGPITAFINNTAVVAVFLPVVEEWCRKKNISVSKMLIPLSYATVLGGMITVVGTSTNVIASGLSKKLGYGEFGLFQFTALGLTTFVIGLIYLAFAAPRLLPDRKPSTGGLGESYGIKDYVSEVIIPPNSALIGQTLRSSKLQRRFDVDVLELIRDDSHFPPPLADKPLQAGDILLVRGGRAEVLKLRDERGIDIYSDVKFGQDEIAQELTNPEENVAEVLLLSNSDFMGSTLKDLRFRQRYNATVLAIRRGEELVRERLGKVSLKFGDLLLVQAPKESFRGLQTSQDLLVLEQRDVEQLRRDKAWIAIAIILSVIVVAAFNWMPILVSALIGVLLMILTGCLKPGEVYGAVRWDIIFLLAGLIPLGTAMEKSGATQWLADIFVRSGDFIPGFWVLMLFYLLTSILTEILSNNAAVILMLPLAVKVATALSLNPLAFMYAVTFSASNSYLTPIGYQTNTMVYAPGGYKFLDFTKVGAPLNLILTIMTPLLITWIYGLQAK